MKNVNCDGTIHSESWSLENNGWRALRRAAPALAAAAMAHFETMCEWQRRYEMRARMARMDDRMLDDVGLTRAQVDAEAAKPFWKD
jgi:uncharacterized protein YjiS (DUF1127 family)